MKRRHLKLKIDSREQLPLEFSNRVFDEVVVEGLPFGDYWAELEGKELPIVIERKALGDLFGTMTQGYKRFKKEMEKAKWAECHMILAIEGKLSDVFVGFKHSEFSGESMLKKLAMLRIRYDLEVMFFDGRDEMRRWVEELFDAVRRNFTREKVGE